MKIIPPAATNPIVTEQGKMTQTMRSFTQLVALSGIIVGTGSPETVVEALQTQLYMDDIGTTGAILYIKRDADIGGDRTQGWILV